MSNMEILVRISIDPSSSGLGPEAGEGLGEALLAHDVDAIVWAPELGSVSVERGQSEAQGVWSSSVSAIGDPTHAKSSQSPQDAATAQRWREESPG